MRLSPIWADCAFLKVRGEVGIPPHHLQRLVPRDVHELVERRAALNAPGSEGVAEVVEPKILDLRPLARFPEAGLDVADGLPFVGKDVARLLRPQSLQCRLGALAKADYAVFPILGDTVEGVFVYSGCFSLIDCLNFCFTTKTPLCLCMATNLTRHHHLIDRGGATLSTVICLDLTSLKRSVSTQQPLIYNLRE